jgi:hypothetical protein
MKKICSFILVFILMLSLIGCSQNSIIDEKKAPSVDPGIVGYIMKIENARFLVVSQVVQDFSSTGGVKEYYDAIWFSNDPKDVEVGDKVNVWYDEVLTSYPGQSEAKHLEVISSQKSDGANLTESEALKKALATEEIDANVVTVVKSIAYDKQADKWSIALKETWGDKVYNIQVEDK